MKHSITSGRFAIATVISCLTMLNAQAQNPGSVESIKGFALSATDTTSSISETLFIGPGSYTIDGNWYIYSKYIWVSPTATITGTGKIQFFNTSAAGNASSSTYLDANNTLFDVALEEQNAQGITMADMADPGFGLDSIGYTSLHISKNFNFAVPNGNFILGKVLSDGTNPNTTVANTINTITDFVMDNTASITNYSPANMFVTSNSIKGHVVRNNYTGGFTFPIGISAGDYTPVNVSNTTAGTIHASVQDYASSASDETLDATAGNGINRTWNIYADNANGNSVINLQHNASTNQSLFDDAAHFVTRWSLSASNNTGDAVSSSPWQSNTLGSGTTGSLSSIGAIANSSMRNRTYLTFATTATAAEAYFSKSSNSTTPLPLQLMDFDIATRQCNVVIKWQIAKEVDLNRFELQYAADGKAFATIQTIYPDNKNGVYTTNDYPENENAYYRLKMIDNNNNISYSDTRFAAINCDRRAYVLFPNPAKEVIDITGISEGDKIMVVDMLGRQIAAVQSKGTRSTIDVSSLAPAFYSLIIVDRNNNATTLKFAKIQ